MIRMLEDLIKIDARSIPLDSKEVMSLFRSTEALGIEMGGDGFCRHIVGRMLNRCKRIDFLAMRHNDDTARMLAGSPFDADTAF